MTFVKCDKTVTPLRAYSANLALIWKHIVYLADFDDFSAWHCEISPPFERTGTSLALPAFDLILLEK